MPSILKDAVSNFSALMAGFSVAATWFSAGAFEACWQLVYNNPEIDAAKSNFEILIIGILN